MQISEPNQNQPTTGFVHHPLWQLPFRSFFLVGGLYSTIALILWWSLLSGHLTMPSNTLPSLVWHVHEMIFGFSATIAVGFVLTAVQTWTGKPSIKGLPVAGLIAVWLVVRFMLWYNTPNSVLGAIILQASWWIFAIYIYAKLVLSAQNRRNYLFIPLLSVMAIVNIVMLVSAFSGNDSLALHLGKSAVLLFTLLMGIVGGRVIPFFTVRGANTTAITPNKLIEALLLPISLLGISVFVIGYFIELPFTPAVLMITGGILHLTRIVGWRTISTASVPLLWSLHFAYAFIGIGLIALGLSYYGLGLSFSGALHLITIGAIGLMIFSMMSRVSLGHTGRALKVKPQIILAFLLLITAALLRALLPEFGLVSLAWISSMICWVSAGLLFFITYWPVLSSPRH